MSTAQFLSFMIVPVGGLLIGALGLWLVRHQDKTSRHHVSRSSGFKT